LIEIISMIGPAGGVSNFNGSFGFSCAEAAGAVCACADTATITIAAAANATTTRRLATGKKPDNRM
jgi:hypothetical protein